MNSMSPVALESDPVAVQWQSDIQVAKWQSIGPIGLDFGLSGTGLVRVAQDWSEWNLSGRMTIHWIYAHNWNSSQGRLIGRLPL